MTIINYVWDVLPVIIFFWVILFLIFWGIVILSKKLQNKPQNKVVNIIWLVLLIIFLIFLVFLTIFVGAMSMVHNFF